MKYSFSWLNNNLCCMGISQLVYPFNYWWMFELFPIWGYYEQSCNAQMCKNFVHKFLCRHVFKSSGYILRNGIAESYDIFMFNLLSNGQTVFHCDGIILPFSQQCMRSDFYISLLMFNFHYPFCCGHPSGCEVVFLCGFNLQFLNG